MIKITNYGEINKKSFIVLSTMFVLFLNHNIHAQDYQLDTSLILTYQNNSIVIQNNNDFDAFFNLKINHFFPMTMEDIMDSIKKIEFEENKSDYNAAWKFVARSTFWTKPISGENWQHDPIIFINSIGGGLCDDKASILAKIWRTQGYDARVINIEGHVVSEIKINNHWEMYDPTLYIYYKNDNKILSVKDLEKNSDIIKKGELRGWRYKQKYQSIEDNRDITEWALKQKNIDAAFTIPSHSKLIFTAYKDKTYVIIQLNKKSKGTISTPLIPSFIHGKIVLSTDNKNSYIQTDEEYTFNCDKNNHTTIISQVFNQSTIFFYINPLLEILKDTNILQLTSTQNYKKDSIKIYSDYIKLSKKEIKSVIFYPNRLIRLQNRLEKRSKKPMYKS
ncbi:MAG: hypothetical protein M9916_10440 [Crocinitomicaceae bacterium]|nr:hypothetical protein [Crocinitomicaceae bacterium]